VRDVHGIPRRALATAPGIQLALSKSMTLPSSQLVSLELADLDLVAGGADDGDGDIGIGDYYFASDWMSDSGADSIGLYDCSTGLTFGGSLSMVSGTMVRQENPLPIRTPVPIIGVRG
jgi:hypothetical protein